jgi:hypothetical protein
MSEELSQNEISDLLNRALNKVMGSNASSDSVASYWVRDVYSTYFIYSDWSDGALYRRSYLIEGDTQNVTLGEPVAVVEKTEYEPIAKTSVFKLDANPTVEFSNEQEYVIKRGKIFEAGSFPDKKFEITPDELKAAAAEFKPVPVDDSHNPRSIFKDKWGELRSVEVKNDKELWGEVAIPKWVDTALGGAAQAVSCTWNTVTKRLAGLALENQPRIADASIFSHFSAQFEGKRHASSDLKDIQDIHDATARLGANCSAQDTNFTINNPNKEISPMSENTNTQQAVDAAGNEAKFAAMQAKLDQRDKELRDLASKFRKQEAQAFVADNSKKLFGEYMPNMARDLYEQFAKDDEANGEPEALATFGQSQAKFSRIAAFKAFINLLPDTKSLTSEQVRVAQDANGQNRVVGNEDGKAEFNSDAKPMEKGRFENLMGHTTVGQTALKGGK